MTTLRPILQPVMQPVLRGVFAPPMRGGGPREIDLFVIVGQSNAEGRGDSAQSPLAPHGRFWNGSALVGLADPVGDALTGSMWPSFSNEWYARTGRMSAFVEAAHGGSALLPDQVGTNWSPSGNLRGNAVAAAQAAIAAINAESAFTLGKVHFVWSQGETDADNGILAGNYQAALESLASYFKAQVPEMTQMLVVRTGVRSNLIGGAEWAAIRSAQDAACGASANLRMVYRGTSSFNAAGRAMMADALHYNQEGFNLAGKCAALAGATLTTNPAVQSAPAILASEAHMDTSVAAGSSSTNAHTTALGTKTLVVAVGLIRMTSNNTYIPNNVTFNGVAMVKANALANQSAGDNSAPNQRADVAIFYLTEAQYGGPLAGVTGDIVVAGANHTVISSAAYDLDSEVVQEVAFGVQIRLTTGSSLPLSLTTGAPAALIGAASSAGLSASPLTHTLSGLVETGDGGVSDGTHCGQVAFGSATVGEVSDSSITATLSADVRAAAFLVAAFRKKIQGE